MGWSLSFPIARHDIATIKAHPLWARGNENDIAVVTLETPIWLGKGGATPVRPDFYEYGEDVSAVVAGWGPLENNASPNLLRYLEVNTTRCLTETGNDVICTSASTETKGVCAGDDGSPLTAHGPGGSLIGVLSSSKPCESGLSGVYTRISLHFYWIIENTPWKKP